MKSEQIVSIYQKSIDLKFTSEIINQEGTFLINSKDHYMSFFLAQNLAKAILCDMNCLNLKKTCQSCQFFDKNQHPDYYCIGFKTKNEDSFYFNEYSDDDVSIVQIRKTIEKIRIRLKNSKIFQKFEKNGNWNCSLHLDQFKCLKSYISSARFARYATENS